MKLNNPKLLDLLSNSAVSFFIPPFQRNYEWGEEQCQTFFNDITKLSEEIGGG